MTAPDRGMAEALDEVVRDVPGVIALYRSGGLLSRAIAAGRDALNADEPAEPSVRVTGPAESPEVTVTIGVGAAPATQTCRDVHDTVAAWLRERGHAAGVITVTVAHVRS